MGKKMKKIFALLSAVLAVSACANDYDCSGEKYEEQCPCQEAAPAPAPCNECYQAPAPIPVVQPTCGTCQGEVRTVREPVEVVYRRRTYGTVYEPRYFENVSYERQNVSGGYGYYQQQAVIETATETVAAPAAPAAPARAYKGPVVLVPAQE